MPRSSRHKSKRSARDAREYSDVEEEVVKVKQHREGKEDGGSGSRYREAGSGEKRKLASTVKEAGGNGNEYSSDEYVGSKRRKEKAEKVGSDRWNGSGEAFFKESEVREESLHYDEKSGKSKGTSELKSKVGSGKNDVEKKEESFLGKEESRSGKEKEESKRKLERYRYDKERVDRDLSRKEAYKQKDVYEKEKGHEQDDRFVDSKRDQDYRVVDTEEPKAKKGADSKDLALEDGYAKHESEKERERRRRKREDEIGEKDRYYQDDNRDNDDTYVISRPERDRDGKDREERLKGISSRDKHDEHFDRDNKARDSEKRDGSDKHRVQKNDDYRDDRVPKEYRDDRTSKDYKDDRTSKDYRDDHASKDCRDDCASKDYPTKKSDSKHTRDETDAFDSRHKKIRTDNYYSGNLYDDQSSKPMDYKDDYGDLRSRLGKERKELEKKSTGVRDDAASDRERSRALHTEESTLGQSRRNRSPNSSVHATREQYRYSKQPDTKYRESLPEERSRHNHTYSREGNGSGVVDRNYSSRASEKSAYREESGYAGEFSSERQRTADRRISPVHMAEKSPSSLSAECKHLNRVGDRRSHDYEDSGPRNNSQKDPNSQFYEGKRGQDVKREATPVDDAAQADGDNMSFSSSFTRSGRASGNSRALLPPPSPLKHSVDNSYAMGSSEEDGRGKLNNRPKRLGDSNIGRMQGNAWRSVPNWPSPMTNGFMPFPHGPPTVGFHPMMQQFPPQMFGVRPPLDHNGIPYHIPDVDRFGGFGQSFGWPNPGDDTCPSPLPNWDSNNMVPGEGYTPGRLDWDQRNLMGNTGRETSVDRYKGINSGMMESPSGNRRGAKVADPVDDMSISNQGSTSEAGGQDNHLNDGNNIKLENHLSTAVSAPEEASKGTPCSEHQAENKRSVDGDDSARRACVYLSRIDVSADLTYSDLFDQCVSLLRRKQNILFDDGAPGDMLEEANGEEESAITCTSSSRAPFLAVVGDSLLEKAMSLYKLHRDETVATPLSSMPDGNQALVPVSNVQGSDPMSTIDRVVLRISSQLEEETGMMPASPGPLSEFPASNVNEQKAAGKSTFVPEQTEVPSPKILEEVDGVDASNMLVDDAEEKSDTDMADASTTLSTNNAAIVNEASSRVDDSSPDNRNKGDGEVEVIKTSATGDQTTTITAALNSGSNDTTTAFEGCEGGGGGIMMTELNEFGSVNLSRIH